MSIELKEITEKLLRYNIMLCEHFEVEQDFNNLARCVDHASEIMILINNMGHPG